MKSKTLMVEKKKLRYLKTFSTQSNMCSSLIILLFQDLHSVDDYRTINFLLLSAGPQAR